MSTIDYQILERLIEAASAAKVELLSMEATPESRESLDAAYVALSNAAKHLTSLVQPSEEPEA